MAIAWGALGRSSLLLHGTEVAERTLYGPGLEAGYEYLSDAGLLFRAVAPEAQAVESVEEDGRDEAVLEHGHDRGLVRPDDLVIRLGGDGHEVRSDDPRAVG